jgi:molecular chaperone GrpE (heat shock protein)
MTRDPSVPRIPKWPFFIADVCLLAVAGLIVELSPRPLGLWQNCLCLLAVAAAGAFSVWPFLQEYRAAVRLAEADGLANVVDQIRDLTLIRDQVQSATAQWQTAQEHSQQTVLAARQVSENMAREARAFTDFLQKANDTEKAHLRLELEKLKRGEGDWIQIVTRLLDHVFALHQAGVRAGQPGLIDQLTQFQNACRDVVRRVGLVPFTAAPGERFDERIHQAADPQAQVPAGSLVTENLATGYTFQAQLLRRALVRLSPPSESPPESLQTELIPDTAAEP